MLTVLSFGGKTMTKLHLTAIFAAIGLIAACSSSSDPAPANAGDAGMNSNAGDGDPSGGDGDPSNGGDGDSGSGTNGDGDPAGDGDPVGDGDPAGDGDPDAGSGDDDAGGGSGSGDAPEPSVGMNQIEWDGTIQSVVGTVPCYANPDLVFNGNFAEDESTPVNEQLNAVIQYNGLGIPETGSSEGATYSLRQGAGLPSVIYGEGSSVFYVINHDDTSFEFIWNDVEFAVTGGDPVLSSGWVTCEL
jgi:hypothetical protein